MDKAYIDMHNNEKKNVAIIIGPSGSGKTAVAKALEKKYVSLDMDTQINTGKKYDHKEIKEVFLNLEKKNPDIIALSVMRDIILELGHAERFEPFSSTTTFRPIIFLKTKSEETHKKRLYKTTAHNQTRPEAQIKSVLSRRREINIICGIVADVVLETDNLSIEETASRIEGILSKWNISSTQ